MTIISHWITILIILIIFEQYREYSTGCSNSFLLGLRNRILPILQSIIAKLDVMRDRARRKLHLHFYDDDLIIDDVMVGFVIMKILHSTSLMTSYFG